MNLLKRYLLEAGLPPDFETVLDARDQASKIQKAIEDSLEESDREPELMAPLRASPPTELIGTVGSLLSIRSRLKRMEIDAGGPEGLLGPSAPAWGPNRPGRSSRRSSAARNGGSLHANGTLPQVSG